MRILATINPGWSNVWATSEIRKQNDLYGQMYFVVDAHATDKQTNIGLVHLAEARTRKVFACRLALAHSKVIETA